MKSAGFAVRGVIEGFYGRPWSHEQRLDLLGFLGERGMNTYVYAPKADRPSWREAGTRGLAELAVRGRQAGVDVIYCLSPGLSLRYSDTKDVQTLCAAFGWAMEAGAAGVGLLLDDIPMRLRHPEDVSAFDDLAEAQVALIDAVFARTGRLTVCPTVYCGTGDDPYLRALGLIDARIDLFWTGRSICSPTIDLADAAAVTRTGYDPHESWERALADVVGDGPDLAAYRVFADNVRGSCLEPHDAPRLTGVLEQRAFARESGDAAAADRLLAVHAKELLDAAEHLLRGPVRRRALVEEARPWLEEFERGALALLAAARQDLRPHPRRRARKRVFGDCLEEFPW
ncbi:beta-N-acetylglucosaminidase domain-containing protein [Nonomuraea sp. NPDC052265]|uniref:beta-N-acetylglucosaminidase domain-containing protein n=1 Tax=Nonomuraea sp. NPDC052265 TaxID=3364374 RepID=UPI0037C608A6